MGKEGKEKENSSIYTNLMGQLIGHILRNEFVKLVICKMLAARMRRRERDV